MASRLKKTSAGGAVAITAAGLMAIQTVGGFEGLKLYAYKDVVGVYTACYGETKGIHAGMRFSKETCNNMLVDSLIEHEKGMRLCLENPDTLPDGIYVADLSLTYNIGVGGFCGSTVARRQNAGHLRASCDAFLAWNKGGRPLRVIPGLTKRRQAERNLCIKAA